MRLRGENNSRLVVAIVGAVAIVLIVVIVYLLVFNH
jgi:hypothetical protein